MARKYKARKRFSTAADKPVADAACSVLERRGIRCWIAPRDATPGLEWERETLYIMPNGAIRAQLARGDSGMFIATGDRPWTKQ